MSHGSTMQLAAALSEHDTATQAAASVAAQLHEALGGPADLVMAFISPAHVTAAADIGGELRRVLSPKALLGVTGEGVVGVGHEVEHGPGLAVLAARLPGVVLQPISFRPGEWAAALQTTAAMQARIEPAPGTLPVNMTTPRAIFLLADPFSSPMLKVLDMIDSAYGATAEGCGAAPEQGEDCRVPVVGGLASAVMEPRGNRLLLNDRVYEDGAVGVALYGPVRVGAVVSQGCRPIGKPWVITKAQRNVVMELGGCPALGTAQEMVQNLDPQDRELVETGGLLVGRVANEYKERFGRGDFLVRAIMGVDREQGYLAIADPQVRVGQTIQFHVRDQRTAQEDFEMLLETQALEEDAAGAILFTCNGRGTKLFDHPHADAKMVAKMLGTIPLAGFFAAGELGPLGRQNYVHGQTACLAVLRPDQP